MIFIKIVIRHLLCKLLFGNGEEKKKISIISNIRMLNKIDKDDEYIYSCATKKKFISNITFEYRDSIMTAMIMLIK